MFVLNPKSLSKAKLVYQSLRNAFPLTNIQNSDVTDLLVGKLSRSYGVCDKAEHARKSFDEIPQRPRGVIQWNNMIRSYAWNGPFEKAVELYYEMMDNGIKPNKFTFPAVLKACSALQAVGEGREIHLHAKRLQLDSDIYICTGLVDMYAKCGCLGEATEVFDGMPHKDVVAWNSMIAGFSLRGGGQSSYNEVINLFMEMQRDEVAPNSSTIVGILPAVAQARALTHGKAMHAISIRKGYHNGVLIGTGFLDMYAKCQCINYARRIFNMMGVAKNEVTWSAMIGGCVACDLMEEGLELFRRLLSVKDDESGTSLTEATIVTVVRACAKLTDLVSGRCLHCYTMKTGSVSDLMVSNTILSMYAKCGTIDHDASRFFNEMALKDAVTYAAIISGYVQNGYAEEALWMFHKLKLSGLVPDVSTMTGILPACSHLAALQHGYCSHAYAIVHGFTCHTIVCNALIDMYAKCGKIHTARKVFDTMHKKDVISWNAMIDAYGIHGLGKDAVSLFQKMQQVGEEIEPDDVTFICLLSACSHSGLVAEGKQLFGSMTQDFGISPRMDHYICMTDLLSRAGHFEEVYKFIQDMPFKPDVRVWGAVLAACRIHKNIELGETVSKEIERLGPESTGNFVLLSNMYSNIGRWDDAAQVRLAQKELGFAKSPGCSWIEVAGIVHAFVGGGDRSHPQSEEINQKLDELEVDMKRLGYRAESSYVFHDVEEEEKDEILLYHSEKLAIAFGILSLSPSKPILVTKNLRVCGDCHNAIKLISLITKREITVRDASRFHHFKDGSCNCGDFW
ncbi:unnamed protein product [Linum tenue]|uniref:DYW domain-containing protein n=1 Tax=Linum tenue TaxID=586396 RepID=A0AAV0M7J5_9ROSI|nr:unnamed protein product [Linum tenue]